MFPRAVAALESVASIINWTVGSAPRRTSRSKFCGMISAARALPLLSSRSARFTRFTWHQTEGECGAVGLQIGPA